MINTSAEWDSLKQVAGGKPTVVVRMYYGDGTNFKSFASRDVTIGGEKFLGVIIKIPKIGHKLNDDHSPSISTMKIEIDNLEYQPGARWSDLVEDIALGAGADIGFYNRRVDVRIFLDGITSFNNCFPLQQHGIFRDVKHSREKTTIIVEDKWFITDQTFGTLIAESDAKTGHVLPDTAKGKILPEIYGDHRLQINANAGTGISATDWQGTRENNLIPMIHTGGDTYFISNHPVATLAVDESNIVEGSTFWALDTTLQRLIEVGEWTRAQNSSSGAKITRDSESYFDYRVPVSGGGDFTNPTNIADRNIATKATYTFNPASPNARKDLALTFPINDIDLALISGLKCYVKYDDDFSSPGEILYYIDDTPADGFSTSGDEGDFRTHLGDVTVANIEAFNLNYEKIGSLIDPITLSAYELFIRVAFTREDEILQLFWGGTGRPYKDWINDRSPHEDNNNEGSLIENFAGVIESALRDLMVLDADLLGLDSFNVASNDLPVASWKCASAITEQINGLQYIFDILRSCFAWLWWQPDGTIKMKVVEDTYSASDRVIDARDVVGLDFDRTGLSRLKTTVEVKYNHSGGEFTSTTGVSSDSTAQTKYKIPGSSQTELILSSKHIGDSTTATNLQTKLLNFWKQPHNIASGSLGKEHLELDLGDIIEFSNMQYEVFGEDITANTSRAGQTIYKYWWIFEVQRSDRLKFKAIQLHDLS